MKPNTESDFWSLVTKAGIDDCWEWKGSVGHKNHPTYHSGNRQHTATRLAWFYFTGEPIPPKMNVMRTCGNLLCLNPTHMRVAKIGSSPFSRKERLYRLVDTSSEDGCWPFVGHRDKCGYGKFDDTLAHRAAWEMQNGPIKAGLYVCHKCDNPPCVRPSHLFLGTQQDNVSDMVSKGRQGITRHGRGGKHKFNMEQIARIQAAYASGKVNQEQIAIVLGVDRSVISRIVNRTKYKQQPITAASQTA
jgi:hypothetical protein